LAITIALKSTLLLRITKFQHSVARVGSELSIVVVLMMTLVTPVSSIAEDEAVASVRLIPSVRVISVGGTVTGVVVDMLLRNRSDSPIFFTQESDDWNYQIEVLGPDGREVQLTNYGKCVLPSPIRNYWSSKQTLEPFARGYPGKVELNKLFKLDQIGLYRMVVSRRVLPLTPGIHQQRGWRRASSVPLFFFIASPAIDSSPPVDLELCKM
jgi:hypothetical protein